MNVNVSAFMFVDHFAEVLAGRVKAYFCGQLVDNIRSLQKKLLQPQHFLNISYTDKLIQ